MPGSGKTTLALRFLIAGAARGERALYITLSETEEELREVGASHGWPLDGVDILQLVPDEGILGTDEQSTMFHPSEVELAETTARILAAIERTGATSMVLDSLSELRLLQSFGERRVLVVDDNLDAAEMLAALLGTLGATVATATSGAAALNQAAAFDPAVVVLDIGMPGMDGYEVARRLRAMPQHATTLLIALTGWGQDEDLQRSREAGIDHHLVKPPDLDRLRDLIAAAPVSRR